jgi:peroxiredoxin
VGEVPLLKDLYAQYKDRGVVVVGISLDETVKPLREMVESKGISWPQVWDEGQALATLFNVKGTPFYYLLDQEGKIAAKDIPFEKLRAAIDDLLKTRLKDQ